MTIFTNLSIPLYQRAHHVLSAVRQPHKNGVGVGTTTVSQIMALAGDDFKLAHQIREALMSTVICKTCEELVDACKHSVRDHMNFLRASKRETARLARKRKEDRDALLAHLRQIHADVVGDARSSRSESRKFNLRRKAK